MNEQKYKDFVNFLFNRNLINEKYRELLKKESSLKGRATLLFEKLVKFRIDDIEEICEYLKFTVIGNDEIEITKKILKKVLEEDIKEEEKMEKLTISEFLELFKNELGINYFEQLLKDKSPENLRKKLQLLPSDSLKKILQMYNLDYVGYYLNVDDTNKKIDKLFNFIDFDDTKKQEELKRQEENKRKYEELKKQEEEKAKAEKLKKEAEEKKRTEEENKKKAEEERFKLEQQKKKIEEDKIKAIEEQKKKDEELKRQQEHKSLIGGFMNIEEYQNKLIKGEISTFKEENNIKTKAEMYIYKGIDINHKDNYTISTDLKIKPYAYLVNGEKNVCGLFELKQYDKKSNEYYLIASKENLKFDNIDNKNYYLHLFDDKLKYKTEVNIKVEDLKETNSILCIDFGTSNTTAGCYLPKKYIENMNQNHPSVLNKNVFLDEVNFVEFKNETDEKPEYIKIIPSVIYIDDCSDENNIKYLIGYDANNKIKKENYYPKGKIFRSVKKWLNDLNQTEEIFDSKKILKNISRKKIIKDYFEFIIDSAQQQFKCKFKKLHLSAPVKLKQQYTRSFQELLGNKYQIINKENIDEGFAVLYNTIKTIKQEENTEKNALIIDCGGGTTDLAKCTFIKEDDGISYKLNITTSSTDGDSNFGGDNITERIMQYMKIIFSDYYTNNQNQTVPKSIDDFITSNVDIFRKVDEEPGINSLYSKLENTYKQCEKIIPTNFQEYKNKYEYEYDMVLNNYYFLWELAEEMKKQFFLKSSIQRNTFYSENNSKDADLNVIPLNKWSLSFYKNGELQRVKENDFPKITFTIKEINQLIKGDVYNVVRKLLDPLYNSKELTKYNIIKLSGQSCKIDIFKDALKEFIAGKALDFKNTSNNQQDYLELKLSCIRGAINYFKDIEKGEIDPIITQEDNSIPFNISTINHRNETIYLIKKPKDSNNPTENINNAIGSILKAGETSSIELHIKDGENKDVKTIIHNIEVENYKETTIESLLSEYKSINQEKHINIIPDKKSSFIVFTDADKYGFWVLNIKKEDSKIYFGQKEFYSFDNM